ncbi:MAG: glycosyltransferase [Candidatus Omnitrophica bacterium]|nr:glycosyltransferase [Candidatus Omnitrophota bacterium]
MGHEVTFFDCVTIPINKKIVPVKELIKKFIPQIVKIPLAVKLAKDKLNFSLREIVNEYRPEIVIVFKGTNITSETLKYIKSKTGAKLLNWYGDSLISGGAKEFVEEISQYYDYFFIIDDLEVTKYVKIFSNKIYHLPFACDPAYCREISLSKEEQRKYGCDVAFVGTITPSREKILLELTDFGLKIWAPQKSVTNKNLIKFYQGIATAEELIKIYNSAKIVLDIHFLFGSSLKIFNVTKRVFEVPACKGFVLTNYCEQLASLYKINEEIVCYNSVEELKDKIKFFLKNDMLKKSISLKGYKKAITYHTWEKRFIKLFSLVNESGNC